MTVHYAVRMFSESRHRPRIPLLIKTGWVWTLTYRNWLAATLARGCVTCRLSTCVSLSPGGSRAVKVPRAAADPPFVAPGKHLMRSACKVPTVRRRSCFPENLSAPTCSIGIPGVLEAVIIPVEIGSRRLHSVTHFGLELVSSCVFCTLISRVVGRRQGQVGKPLRSVGAATEILMRYG